MTGGSSEGAARIFLAEAEIGLPVMRCATRIARSHRMDDIADECDWYRSRKSVDVGETA